jgi:endo-1,4-beta-xylanase
MLNCAGGATAESDELGTTGPSATTATHGAAQTSTNSSSVAGPSSSTTGGTTGGNGGPGRELGGVCYPICSQSMSTEGTGWGWENEETCLVQGTGPYQMGSDCTLGSAGPAKFVGNITTMDMVDTDGKTFANYWDQLTPENAGKWGNVQMNAGAAFNWATLDAIYDHAEQQNLVLKQHTFIWGRFQPSGAIGENDVKSWMREFCSRYPNVELIDVVNEPPPHTEPAYANSIGGGTDGSWQWIINAFEWAHEACPNAVLVLNDYNNIEWEGDTNHFLDIVKTVQAAGAPIDAIGAQAHDLDHASVTFATVQKLLNRLHDETGLPIYISEMDISTTDDDLQLKKYQQYFPLFYKSPFVSGITIWGWIYGKTWSEAPESGLVRNGNFRPAMSWLMQELGRPTN